MSEDNSWLKVHSHAVNGQDGNSVRSKEKIVGQYLDHGCSLIMIHIGLHIQRYCKTDTYSPSLKEQNADPDVEPPLPDPETASSEYNKQLR